MSKISWKPGTMLAPVPAVMVSCGANEQEYNILTIAWTGITCTNPPCCYIAVRPERYSYDIIKRNESFVINLTTKKLAYATDWCGVKSGKDFNKFQKMNLTPIHAEKVSAPIIKESPVNIECKVINITELGSHHLFSAEIVNIQVDESLIDPKTELFDIKKAELIAYSHGNYYEIGDLIGRFGFSVMKPKTKKRLGKK